MSDDTPYQNAIDRIAGLERELGRLTKARAKLAERLHHMADYEHRKWNAHSPYSLEECPFIGCRDNAYALRLGKPRRKAAGS